MAKTIEEIRDAALALSRWFESQEIEPQEAVAVMTVVISGIVKMFPEGKDRNKALEAIETVLKRGWGP